MKRRRALVALVLALALAPGCKRETPSPPSSASTAPAAAHPSHVPPGALQAEGIGYIEQITGGASADEPLPMIVGMHGRGGRPENFLRNFFRDFHARARIILPYGTDPLGDGFEWFAMSATLPPDAFAADVERAAHHVARMIAALQKTRPTVGKPIVTGFSQGGFLSYALAVLHPDLIAEADPVSGRLPPELWPSTWPPGQSTPPIHALHGDADTIVPVADDRQLVARLKQIGLPVELHEYRGVEHTVTAEMRRDLGASLVAAAEQAQRP